MISRALKMLVMMMRWHLGYLCTSDWWWGWEWMTCWKWPRLEDKGISWWSDPMIWGFLFYEIPLSTLFGCWLLCLSVTIHLAPHGINAFSLLDKMFNIYCIGVLTHAEYESCTLEHPINWFQDIHGVKMSERSSEVCVIPLNMRQFDKTQWNMIAKNGCCCCNFNR